MPLPPLILLRHPKERLSKCTLEPLRGRAGVHFLKAGANLRYDASGHVLLAVDAPALSPADCLYNKGEPRVDPLPAPIDQPNQHRERPVLLLDSTWRLLPQLEKCIVGEPLRRALPSAIHTAYPRKSKLEPDPEAGLASIEALFAALFFMGHNDPTLLDGYHWKEAFLQQDAFTRRRTEF